MKRLKTTAATRTATITPSPETELSTSSTKLIEVLLARIGRVPLRQPVYSDCHSTRLSVIDLARAGVSPSHCLGGEKPALGDRRRRRPEAPRRPERADPRHGLPAPAGR